MLTRGGKICDWIEGTCRIPEGRYVGEHMVLLDFQRDLIDAIYNNAQAKDPTAPPARTIEDVLAEIDDHDTAALELAMDGGARPRPRQAAGQDAGNLVLATGRQVRRLLLPAQGAASGTARNPARPCRAPRQSGGAAGAQTGRAAAPHAPARSVALAPRPDGGDRSG
jgi:hypothetical protein